MKMRFAAVPFLALLSGCFTLSQTEMPRTEMTRAPEGRDVKVALSGFAATITEYIPVYGWETVYVDRGYGRFGPRGRRYWRGGHYETASTETLIPQTRANEAFLDRARAALEENGFLLRAPDARWTVDVAFSGPFVSSSETAKEWAWMLCSILTTEYAVQTWTAKLKIYDNATGRIAFAREYSRKYENLAFSPLFFIGLSAYAENTYNYMQSWCLTALTDAAVADATAYLAGTAGNGK